MITFLEEYQNGEPVVVYGPDGNMLGIPCGFVIFPDGLSWADDGVLAKDYASHHPRHHLFAPVARKKGSISCAGRTFSPAPLWHGGFGKAWNSLALDRDGWREVHRAQEEKLIEERSRI